MTNKFNDGVTKDHRVILLIDDDYPLMYNYANWMSALSNAYHDVYRSFSHKLYDLRVYDIKDLTPTLDKIRSNGFTLDLVISDFDLIDANGNDVAKKVRANFPDVKIIGNTGGDPARFDKKLVDLAVDKITDPKTFYATIKKNTSLVKDCGIDFFSKMRVRK